MELPFEKKTERFWQQKLYAPVMREESQELRLPESMPDVGRVIAAWGQPVLRGKQWRDDHITIEGGVMVWVLYHPEDGSGPGGWRAGCPSGSGWTTATAGPTGSSGRSRSSALRMPGASPPGS